jgi:hypothetical protein
MPAYRDELFGPVAAIIPVQGEEEAIRVANDTVLSCKIALTYSKNIIIFDFYYKDIAYLYLCCKNIPASYREIIHWRRPQGSLAPATQTRP